MKGDGGAQATWQYDLAFRVAHYLAPTRAGGLYQSDYDLSFNLIERSGAATTFSPGAKPQRR